MAPAGSAAGGADATRFLLYAGRQRLVRAAGIAAHAAPSAGGGSLTSRLITR